MAVLSGVGLYCLSLVLYHEARGEHTMGQFAVASVVLHRVEKKYGKEYVLTDAGICSIMAEKKQFSFTNNQLVKIEGGWKIKPSLFPKDRQAWNNSVKIAKTSLYMYSKGNGVDFSKGATHYHAKTVSPYWSEIFGITAIIGGHVFYKEKR